MQLTPLKFKHGAASWFAAAKIKVPLERAWRRCAIAFLVAFLGGLGSIYAFLLLVDPYDTGRFPTPLAPGVFAGQGLFETGQRTGNASRGRDPRFNAAIFGDSRTQLLDPAKLSEATGLSFVQLTTPGSGPKEQITLMRYFLRHHPGAEVMVLGVDEYWCGHDPSAPVMFPFPFWLYRGDLEYFTHLLSTRAFRDAQTRLKLAMGLVPPADPRGYVDYDTGHVWNFRPPATPAPDLGTAAAEKPANTYFPAFEELDVLLSELPPQTRFVTMIPPVYHTALPRPGTQAAAELRACKAELARRLGGRAQASLDFLVDGPISHDPENFMDLVHYRLNVARIIESRIATALGERIPAGAGDR
jgi:hypothetical protein